MLSFKFLIVLISLVGLSEYFITFTIGFITDYDPNDPTLIIANDLPIEDFCIHTKRMPYIGNGHLGSIVFSAKYFINGLYNGKKTTHHRCYIPNNQNFQIVGRFPRKQYILNLKQGVFIEQLENDKISIQRKIYAHQYYNRLMVTHIQIKKKINISEDMKIVFDDFGSFSNRDISFNVEKGNNNYQILKGQNDHVDTENEQFNVTYFYTPVRNAIFPGNKTEFNKTFLQSVDFNETAAMMEMDLAIELVKNNQEHEKLYEKHVTEFEKIWELGRIQVDNVELNRQLLNSFYVILSSLPAREHFGVLNRFYGLSIDSLSRGYGNADAHGHVFWQSEIWMFPPILMFYPDKAKDILSFRINAKEAAIKNAENFNAKGWKFAWESAFTLLDVIQNSCCDRLHINADISFAARQYLSATKDIDWLSKEGGSELINGIAEFWSSRMSYDQSLSQYQLNETSEGAEIKNDVYTNIAAAKSIFLADYANCLLNGTSFVDSISKAVEKAKCLRVPFNDSKDMHLEYDGYEFNDITEPLTILIGYPLLFSMNESTRKNDMYFYESVMKKFNQKPNVYAMYCIGFIEIGDEEKAAEYFNKTYQNFAKQPFKVWLDTKNDKLVDKNVAQFLPGAAGLLQTVLFGYGGLRLHMDGLKFKTNMPLPPNTNYLYFHRIKYLGSELSFNYTKSNIVIHVNKLNPDPRLAILSTKSNVAQDLTEGQVINLNRSGEREEYSIKSKSENKCHLPDDLDRKNCNNL